MGGALFNRGNTVSSMCYAEIGRVTDPASSFIFKTDSILYLVRD